MLNFNRSRKKFDRLKGRSFFSFIKNSSFAFSVALVTAISATPAQAELKPLSLSDLDSISAGYVNIYAESAAEADGIDPVAEISGFTSQVSSEPDEDGYIYTDSYGEAHALAEGQTVYTAVDVGFDTDEEIVSLEFGHSLETSAEVVPVKKANKNKKHKNKKNKNKKNKNKNKNKKKKNRKKDQKNNKKKNNKKKKSNKKKKNNNKKKKRNKKRKQKNKSVIRLKQKESAYVRVVTRKQAPAVVVSPT